MHHKQQHTLFFREHEHPAAQQRAPQQIGDAAYIRGLPAASGASNGEKRWVFPFQARADATFDLHTNAWDVAAGALMVRAGGGRYLGLRAGVTDENPTTAHLRPAYWATGGDVEYPTLREVLTGLSRDGRVHGSAEPEPTYP